MSSSENIQSQISRQVLFGNDIVDLNDPDTTCPDERSLERIFTSSELGLVEKSGYDKKIIWKLWSCKEAAFKAISGVLPDTPFRWKSFEVMKDFDSVRYGDHEISVELESNDKFIHAVAAGRMECDRSVKNRTTRILRCISQKRELHGLTVQKRLLLRLPENKQNTKGPEDQNILSREEFLSVEDILKYPGSESAMVRLLGVLEIEKHFNISAESLLVSGVKRLHCAPAFYKKNGDFISFASFSHHGDYYAVAFPA